MTSKNFSFLNRNKGEKHRDAIRREEYSQRKKLNEYNNNKNVYYYRLLLW